MIGLNAYSPKQAEIGALRQFASQCPPGCCLHSFLSPPLLKWIENAIGDDVSTDLMGTMLFYRRQALAAERAARQAQRAADEQLRALEADLDRERQVSARNAEQAQRCTQELLSERQVTFRLQQELEAKCELIERQTLLIAHQQLQLFERQRDQGSA